MGDTVRLTVVRDEGEAEAICGLLRSEQIQCTHWPTNVAVEGGGFFSGANWTEVLVNQEDLARAQEVLASAAPLEAECVECGRPIGDDGRWHSDETGELLPYCAGCAEREFGPG